MYQCMLTEVVGCLLMILSLAVCMSFMNLCTMVASCWSSKYVYDGIYWVIFVFGLGMPMSVMHVVYRSCFV